MFLRRANGTSPAGTERRPHFALPVLAIGVISVIGVTTIAVAIRVTRHDESAAFGSPRTAPPTVRALGWSGDTLVPTFYIVTSEEAGARLRLGLTVGERIRNGMGLRPVDDSVAVVGSEDDAAALEASIIHGNSVLDGLGRPVLRVVR